jgi:hypothetical protein
VVNYIVTLTETEDMAFSSVALSQQEWIDNLVHERCRVAIEDIVKETVKKCLENNITIPSTKEEIVALSFEQGWTMTVVEANAIRQQEMLNMSSNTYTYNT